MHTRGTTLLLLVHALSEAWGFQKPVIAKQRLNNGYSTLKSTSSKKSPGTANLGEATWKDLGFGLVPTNSHVQITYKENSEGQGGWSEPQLVSDPYLKLHIAATALHYGQACLEGMKAFCHQDNTVHLFRPIDHATRMQTTCRRILMPELPVDKFIEAIELVVRDNIEYIPPYGSNGALYIRPLLFGSGPRVGVQPANEYTFVALVVPVGSYYSGGLSRPVKGFIMEEYDRAAPYGVGGVKVAGNYAAAMLPSKLAKESGYDIALYLDAKSHETIEEFSTSSFVGINSSARKYVTPVSESVLQSITNKSIMQLAADMEGWTVEVRDIQVEELASLDEVMAVGTGVVVTPVGSLTRRVNHNDSQTFHFGETEKVGQVTQRLYTALRGIQNGDVHDSYAWNHKVEY